jgi:hypothetical protein
MNHGFITFANPPWLRSCRSARGDPGQGHLRLR